MLHSFFHQNQQFTRSFSKRLNERLASINLYHSQWVIIYYLSQFETSTLVEISNYLHVEKPTITRTVNRLEERELIEKFPTKDKRERRIRLTEKGFEISKQALKIVSDFESELLQGIPEADLKTALQTVQRLRSKLT
ncbi:MarR family winged helix-turn-helix transcriptional regulator [Virgibacillus kimchii]